MPQYKVGILGATGAVGQKFIRLLQGHPWFEIAALGASERSAGKRYSEAAQWVESTPLPGKIGEMTVRNCQSGEFSDVDFVFSGLDAAFTETIEANFAGNGIPVISNVKNYRMHDHVPLLIYQENQQHNEMINHQTFINHD